MTNQDLPTDSSEDVKEEITASERPKEEETADAADSEIQKEAEASESPQTVNMEEVVESREAIPSDSSPAENKESNEFTTDSPAEIAEEEALKETTDADHPDEEKVVKESDPDEAQAKDTSNSAEEEQDMASPIVVETAEETKSPERIELEKIQMATEAAKSAIAQQRDPTKETQTQPESETSELAPSSPKKSSVPLSNPQLFPATEPSPQASPTALISQHQPMSSVPVSNITVYPSQAPARVQSSPQVSPTASVQTQAFPQQSPTQMQASPQVSSMSQQLGMYTFVNQPHVLPVQASPRASPTPFDHLIQQQVPPVPMHASPQLSPSSATQPMHVQTVSVSTQQTSPMFRQSPNQMHGSPHASPMSAPQPVLQTYPQLPHVPVPTTAQPQATPISSGHTPTPVVVPAQAPVAPLPPQSSPTGSLPVSQVQLSPQASPTSALSNPPASGSPKSNFEANPAPSESSQSSPWQQEKVADDGDDDDSVYDPEQGGPAEVGAKDQFHQDQFMEEFHAFQKKSAWEKFTYKVRNYTWQEKLPILAGILLFLVGLGLVIWFFAGGSAKSPSFIISQSDQCQAVVNGNALPNEDELPVMRLNWIVDVSTYEEWETVTDLTAEVKSKFQSLVLPTLAGCVHEKDEDARAAKYKVANGFVRNAREVGDCASVQRRPCARFYINVALWMREETKVNAFLTHLLAEFGYEIVQEIESSEMISAASLVNIESFGR